MRMRHVNVSAVSPAPAETLYKLLTDGSSWPRWSPIESFELERAGDPPPEGFGAIRVFRLGRTTGRDQILELVPNRRIAYATISGVPVQNYVGEVDLEPAPGGGTTVHWHSSFAPKTPGIGWIIERSIRRFLERCAHGLADYARATSISGSPSPTDTSEPRSQAGPSGFATY
jgi:uncharacterized protein YndB with AHSA1/START domain